MKRKINLSKTFSTLRELPLEINFEQVEQWVNNTSKPPKPINKWLYTWLLKLVSWRPFS